jgi:hypothetical protein
MKIPDNVKLIEEPNSIMWFDVDGILCVVGKKAEAQTIEEAKKSTEDFKKMVGNRKICMMLDITDSSPTTKEVRDYSAQELIGLTKALALISRSALGKMVANLFFGLKPPPYPAKMFTNEQDAREWLKQYL